MVQSLRSRRLIAIRVLVQFCGGVFIAIGHLWDRRLTSGATAATAIKFSQSESHFRHPNSVVTKLTVNDTNLANRGEESQFICERR
jgi:hypothetical protein